MLSRFPITEIVHNYQGWDEGGHFTEFRLYYRGPLPAETSRSKPKYKHMLRQQFHAQLKELWQQDPRLRKIINSKPGEDDDADEHPLVFARGLCRGSSYHFLPLVREDYQDYCSLDILFLRRDFPGGLVSYGGDIDNRLKVLMDSLAVPNNTRGMPESPEPGEDPLYCLLEDDSLITSISITTDRLLTPIASDEGEHDVVLVIRVVTQHHDVFDTGTGW